MISFIKNLFRYRELIFELAKKDVETRFKQSYLGPIWIVLHPCLLIIVFVILRSFLKIPSDGIPYPIFALTSLLPWILFTNGITRSASSMLYNRAIIKKVYFPREVFPVASILASASDFLFSCGIYLCLMFYYRIPMNWCFLFIPVVLIIQLVFTMSIGIGLSMLAGFRRDFIAIVPLLTTVLIYISPVFYSISSVPEKYIIFYKLNPLANIFNAYRQIIFCNTLPINTDLLYTALIAILSLKMSIALFRKLEGILADVL